MKKVLLFAALLSGCTAEDFNGYTRGVPIVKGMTLTLIYQGEKPNDIGYLIDSSTMLCYAHAGVHGFTCVPCDSLKKLKLK